MEEEGGVEGSGQGRRRWTNSVKAPAETGRTPFISMPSLVRVPVLSKHRTRSLPATLIFAGLMQWILRRRRATSAYGWDGRGRHAGQRSVKRQRALQQRGGCERRLT